MAANISRVKTSRHDLEELTFTALSTTGVTIDFDGVDEKTVLIFTSDATDGANDDTITILKGNSIQGVKDLTLPTLTKGKFYAAVVPSMEFKNVSGANKGYIVVKGKATTSVAVVEAGEM